MRTLFLTTVSLMCCTLFSSAVAAYTIKDGKLIPTHEIATHSAQEHFSKLKHAVDDKKWEEVILQSNILMRNFPDSPFSADSNYYLGIGYFHIGELERSNSQFTEYLKNQSAPTYFEESITYKFKIADSYKEGAKKHILGLEVLPKWVPAKEEALEIYEEVLVAMPHSELAAQALFGKAQLLFATKEFKASIDTYQNLIRKFSKHPLACESYIGIGKVFLTQCLKEYPDPDFLDLAKLNLKKFSADFPNEPRISIAETMLDKMNEVYAGTLYQTAQFYERTKKQSASAIYYNKIIAKYPLTKVANNSEKRLASLEKKLNRPLRDNGLLHVQESDVVNSNIDSQAVSADDSTNYNNDQLVTSISGELDQLSEKESEK